MSDLLLGTTTEAKPVTVTYDVIKEAMEKIEESYKKESVQMLLPVNYLQYLKPEFKLKEIGRNRYIAIDATA